jgi:HSP20 family molecular chaperone IbpA
MTKHLLTAYQKGSTKHETMTFIRPFELDQFDLLWKDLFNSTSHFSDITQKISHPVDIFETEAGIRFEVAAVGLDKEDISIVVEGDQLRITYEKPNKTEESQIYRGIKRSSFNLTWKISTKFDLNKLEASLDKGLLILNVPTAEGKAVKQIKIK